MRKKHVRVFKAIFEDPVRAGIKWRDVESLLIALGGEIDEAEGSRVGLSINSVRAVFHDPHPGKEIGKGMVRSLRAFFLEAGLKIDETSSKTDDDD